MPGMAYTKNVLKKNFTKNRREKPGHSFFYKLTKLFSIIAFNLC